MVIEDIPEFVIKKSLCRSGRLSNKRQKLDSTDTEFLPLPQGTATASQSAAMPEKSADSQKNQGLKPDNSLKERVKNETAKWVVRLERGVKRRYVCNYPNCGLTHKTLSNVRTHIFTHIGFQSINVLILNALINHIFVTITIFKGMCSHTTRMIGLTFVHCAIGVTGVWIITKYICPKCIKQPYDLENPSPHRERQLTLPDLVEIGILNAIHTMKEFLVSNIATMVSVSQGDLYQPYVSVKTKKFTEIFSLSEMWIEQEVSSNKFNFTYSKNRDGESL